MGEEPGGEDDCPDDFGKNSVNLRVFTGFEDEVEGPIGFVIEPRTMSVKNEKVVAGAKIQAAYPIGIDDVTRLA